MEVMVETYHGKDMDYALCRRPPGEDKTAQLVRPTTDFPTLQHAIQYAIKNHWRVIVDAGGKYYYFKGKNYSVDRARNKILESPLSSTRGKQAHLVLG